MHNSQFIMHNRAALSIHGCLLILIEHSAQKSQPDKAQPNYEL